MNAPRPQVLATALLAFASAIPGASAQGTRTFSAIDARPVSGEALVVLPARTGSVAQSLYRDGIRQTITLNRPGSARADQIEVAIRIAHAGPGTGPTIAMTKPTRLGIAEELERRFPSEPMSIVTRPTRNAYGPVGLAIGETCLYAWQWVDTVSAAPPAGDRVFASSGLERPASLRIELCRSSKQTMSDLVAAVEQLRIRDPLAAGAVAVATPLRVRRAVRALPARAAEAGAPPAGLADAGPRPQPTLPRDAKREERRPPRVAAVPTPNPGREPARRYLVPDEASVRTQQLAPAPSRSVAPSGGPRYITDRIEPSSPDVTTEPSPLVPKPASRPLNANDRPVMDLPAQALQGPPSR